MKSICLAVLFLAAASASAQLGSITFPNSGKPEAQAAFLRGVAALHSFWYDEAADAFREAERIDPDFALAYWGEAMTFNHPIWNEVDVEAGRRVLARLRDRQPDDGRERGYLDAVRRLYGNGEKAERDRAYEAAMESLAKSQPADVEAQAFYALAILGTKSPGETDMRKQIRAAVILEPLYAAHPDHPGVLHYMIHAYDDPLHAPLGLRAAQRYAKVAPAAFHALHMPSHIFLQLGMWDETIASNEHAYAVSKKWAGDKHLGRAKRDLHSLQWLQYAYLQNNRLDDARKLIDEIAQAAGEEARERTTRANMLARYAIETSDWSVLPATLTMTDAGASSHAGCAAKSYGDDSSALAFAYGLAAVAQNHPKAAAEALEQLKARVGEKKNPAAKVMAKELEAMMAANTAHALKLAAEAAALEDAMGIPSGPPDTFKPAHELYAELLLKTGRREDARKQFDISLSRAPNRRLSQQGMRVVGFDHILPVPLDFAAVAT
jgi:tetratricopeptide (TPR) repeat protein